MNLRFEDVLLCSHSDWCILDSVTIGDVFETIGVHAFQSCSKLKAVNIRESVEITVHSAFYSCPSLKNITTPSSFISIGDIGIQECSLKFFYFYSEASPTVYSDPFSDVPAASVMTLKQIKTSHLAIY